MPGLYRSKSYRRYEETNNRLTNFIEKDNTKVLATASAQLYISSPQIDRWFKSSTGTICFLKSFTKKSSYFFRLYSLMQGQLWEQEMESPFEYNKANSLFHYLTLNRFNYGFKFICEDEAEHFFSLVRKFCSSPLLQQPLAPQHQQSSILSSIEATTNETTTTTMTLGATQCDIDRTALSQMSLPSCSALPPLQQQQTASHEFSQQTNRPSRGGGGGGVGNASQTTTTTTSSSMSVVNVTHKSRRFAYSSDRGSSNASSSSSAKYMGGKKAIEKSDISCPFRCSCVDLSGTGAADSTNGEVQQRGSTEMIKKYSTVVKELASSQNLFQQNDNPTPSIHIQPKPSTAAAIQSDLDETIKQIILNELSNQPNIASNPKLIQSIKEYINDCGGLENFKRLQERSENERHKLQAFVAASSSILSTPTKSPNKTTSNRRTTQHDNILIDSPTSNKLQQTPRYGLNSPITPTTTPFPLKSSLKQQTPVNASSKSAAIEVPKTANLYHYRQQKLNIGISNTYLLTPPKSAASSSHNRTTQVTKNQQHCGANTPIASMNTSSTSSMVPTYRYMSPSPPPQNSARLTSQSTGVGLNAPPKPPRRASLKINY